MANEGKVEKVKRKNGTKILALKSLIVQNLYLSKIPRILVCQAEPDLQAMLVVVL